jgi:hypothetical protein
MYVCPFLSQETEDWLQERFGRLEQIAAHSEEVMLSALQLVQGDLQAIREARQQLNV